MKTTFIYALCEPGTRTVRYIGKADNPTKRHREHLLVSAKLDTYLGHWISSLQFVGAVPDLVILREVPMEGWKEEEVRYIRSARVLGMKLVNGTDGGEGCFNPTPATRAKMSTSSKGRKMPASITAAAHTPEANAKRSATNRGRKHTPERCANISASKKGLKMPPRTPEHRANLSAALKGRAPCAATLAASKTPEVLAKLSAVMKGRAPCSAAMAAAHTPEANAKRSATVRGRPPCAAALAAAHTPEANAKRSATVRGRKQSPETIAARVARNTGQKRTPEQRERMGVAQRAAAEKRASNSVLSEAV